MTDVNDIQRLDGFVAAARKRVAAGYYQLEGKPRPNNGSLVSAVCDMAPMALIAEVKRRAPSTRIDAPPLPDHFPKAVDPRADDASLATGHARAYAQGGACGISVLTDPDTFGGSLQDLDEVTGASGRPTLMKDFIVDTAQLDAAVLCGASAVLGIVTVHDRGLATFSLSGLVEEAHRRDLEVVLEARSMRELATARQSGADILAVNARNLDTLALEMDRCEAVLRGLDDRRPTLWLSGIQTYDDVKRARFAGADGVLVGSVLMSAADPAAMIRYLLRGTAP